MTSAGHRLIGMTGILTVLSVTFLLFVPAAGFACSCAPSPSPCVTLASADAIFIGTPVAVDPQGGQDGMRRVRVHFEVERSIKAIDAKTVDIETLDDTAACGYHFERGVKYLVYASRGTASLSVSFCSRTGPLDARMDDLELLLETLAVGTVRPRLFGVVHRVHLRLDGFYLHYEGVGGVPDVPIRVRDGAQVREVRTDQAGHFSVIGLTPGRHVVEAQLPSRYAPLFDEEIAANVDSCGGEVAVAVTTVPLRGTARHADGTAGDGGIVLRLAQIGPDGGVVVERSTLAITRPDGTWNVPGLPPGHYLLGVSAFEPPTPDSPYPTMWYPDASRPEKATVLDVSEDRRIAVDFRLPPRIPEFTVTGVTLDAKGAPIPNVQVELTDVEARAASRAVGYATSDHLGRFSISGLRGRHYRIQGRVAHPGGAESDLIDVSDEAALGGVTVTLKQRR